MPKAPKPSRQITLTTVYGSVAEDLKRRIGDAQAAQAGPPVSEEIVPATDETRVEAWNARRPEATDEAMLALAQQKYQEHLQQGMPADKAVRATAEDLTHFRYGQRLKLYTYGQIGFKDQVAEAKRLKRLAERSSTPDPPPPPPTMPTAALTNAATMNPELQAPEAAPPPGPPTGLPAPMMGAAPPAPIAAPGAMPAAPPPTPEAPPPEEVSRGY